MKPERYLELLGDDARRLRQVAGGDLGAAVPSCPGWTVADLVRHVALVYLHKVECIRRNEFPKPWPPDLAGVEPLALFDRAYAGLVGELASRDPASPAATWYGPEQTVGFWIRRMAHETVIHRIDAELATSEPAAPVPTDLAADGVDEVLTWFLSYGSKEWAEDFGEQLTGCDGRAVLVTTGDQGWLVWLHPDGVRVEPAAPPRSTRVDGRPAGPDDAESIAGAALTGEPQEVLLWLWRRVGDEAITCDGDLALIGKLRDLLGTATQ